MNQTLKSHSTTWGKDLFAGLVVFENETAPAHGVVVSKVGFKEHYEVKNQIQYVDFVSRELQQLLTPEGVLAILCEGNERFRTGRQLSRDLGRQMGSTTEAVPNPRTQPQEFAEFVDRVAQLNVLRTMAYVRTASPALAELSRSGRIQIVGCMYDLRTGKVAFFDAGGQPLAQKPPTKISTPVSEGS